MFTLLSRFVFLVLVASWGAYAAYAQTYQEYANEWEDQERARFITYRFDEAPPISLRGYVSDWPAEWSHNLGFRGQANRPVNPFCPTTTGSFREPCPADTAPKHVLIMVHGYGANTFEVDYEDRDDAFMTDEIEFDPLPDPHDTGATPWFNDQWLTPSIYNFLRSSSGEDSFHSEDWVVLATTMNVIALNGRSILENAERLVALMDLLWDNHADQIRTISFMSHSTGGPITKSALTQITPSEHPWLAFVDDHLNLAGALSGTSYVNFDFSPFSADLRHQLTYGIQDPRDYTDTYRFSLTELYENGRHKRSKRWPSHINVLSVAGVWSEGFDFKDGQGIADGLPFSTNRQGLVLRDPSHPIIRFMSVFEGEYDGLVSNWSVLEWAFYTDLNPLNNDEPRYQIEEGARYGADYSSSWALPSGGYNHIGYPYSEGAGPGDRQHAEVVEPIPAADRFPGEKVTYIEVEAQHNGIFFNEYLHYLIRKRLGSYTVMPQFVRPELTELSTQTGSVRGGEQVVLTGKHLSDILEVRFGDTPAVSWTVDSDTRVTITTPAVISSRTVEVTVRNRLGVNTPVGSETTYHFLNELDAPRIDPPGGVFDTPQEVVITADAGANVYYTLNDTAPTLDNSATRRYTDPIMIPAALDGSPITLRAQATRADAQDSPEVEATFQITAQVDVPTMSIDKVDQTSPVQVTLDVATPEATIFYTLDGSEPDYTSTRYTQPFTLTAGTYTIQARAYRLLYVASQVLQEDLNVYSVAADRVDTPTVYPLGSGDFPDEVTVRMESFVAGASIRYTIAQGQLPDPPTEQDTEYTGSFRLVHDPAAGNQTDWFVRVRAFRDGLPPSNTVQRSYSVSPGVAQAETPTFDPPPGTYINPVELTVASATPFARLFLTYDGTPAIYDPDLSSQSSPFTVTLNRARSVRVRAFRPFFSVSDETMGNYAFRCGRPEVSIVGQQEDGRFLDQARLTLLTQTEDATLFFTTDGSVPTAESNEYAEPFDVTTTTTVRVLCQRNNFLDSEVVTVNVPVGERVAPVITDSPQSVMVNEGEPIRLGVRAVAVPSPTYQWHKDGEILPGATADSLVIPSALPDQAGDYFVVVQNDAGEDTSDVATVSVEPREIAPQILTQPVSLVAETGSGIRLSVVASGKPSPTYQWYHNNAPIPDGIQSDLVRANLTPTAAGVYHVVVSNVAGSVQSESAEVVVVAGVPPVIIEAEILPEIQATTGDTVQVSARVQTHGTLTNMQWYRDEDFLRAGPLPKADTVAVLVLDGVTDADEGVYSAILSSTAGIDTARVAVLNVQLVGTNTDDPLLPMQFSVETPYPNPVQSIASLPISIPEALPLKVTVFDVLGRRLRTLDLPAVSPGRHVLRLDLSQLANGVYLYQVQIGAGGGKHQASGQVVVAR